MDIAKLYTDKSAITAADLLKDRVIPFVDALGIRMNRILTDRSTEYGRAQAGTSRRTTPISSTWRWRTSTIPGLRPTIPSPTASASGSTKPSRTNPPEAESLPSRKKLYRSLEELQVDLDAWLDGQLQPGASPVGTILPPEDSLGDIPTEQAPGISQ